MNVVAPEVVATGWLPNPKLAGVRLALGSTPLPVRLTDWPPALSVAEVDPRPVGAKLTLIVQVVVICPPQVLPSRPKSPDPEPVIDGPLGLAA